MEHPRTTARIVRSVEGLLGVTPSEGGDHPVVATLSGVYVETDDKTGLARRIAPVRVGGRLAQASATP